MSAALGPRTLWLLAVLCVVTALAIDWRRLNAQALAESDRAGITTSRSFTESTREPSEDALRVLFIGNSLTSVNDMPTMIAELADAAGEEHEFAPSAELKGGTSLLEHLELGKVQKRISDEGPWHAVVLQEQGGRAGDELELMKSYTLPAIQKLQVLISAAGTQPVLFEPYARRGGYSAGDSYEAMQDRIRANYALLTRELDIPAVPVGEIWRAARLRRPTLQLWNNDGMHPSPAGAYLVACAFYAYFYRKSPVGNTYTADLDPLDAASIQATVADQLGLH
jgi:hypothetical protein